MKAVILAAGKGKRLRPITSTRPKPMIPLAGKPLLEHTIIGLREASIQEILLIVGYKEEIIKNYFKDGSKFGVKIKYITQEEYLGTAQAASLAKEFVNEDTFLMVYGDLLVDSLVFQSLINKFAKYSCQGVICLKEVPNPKDYGIVSLDTKGYMVKIIEKPSMEANLGNLVNAGIYLFSPIIFEAIKKTKKSSRNEFEFTESMEILIKEMNGKIQSYVLLDEYWNDIGLPWQILDANQFLLNNLQSDLKGEIEDQVKIKGNVYIGENSKILAGSYIQGPCFIGKNNLIGPNAFIRPYTSISDDCHIGISEIKNTLIFSKTAVPHFNYIGDSIICENVNLGAGTKVSNLRFDNKNVNMIIDGKSLDSKRRKLGAIIGPNSQTGINVSIMCGKIIGEGSVIGAHTIVNENIEPNTLYYQDTNGKRIIKKNPFWGEKG
ncbi:MAG: bifunctional sugar-1-phosphate nucleotidylyltransferase/acetyltransferase [Candidatus Thorarchaeota archaeon]